MKRAIFICSAVVMTAMMLSSCGDGASNQEGASNEESTSTEEIAPDEVTIGNQVWMTKNLNVDKFRNGDPIPEAKTDEEWWSAVKNKQPAWCYYDNDPANGEKYGKLYNWYAVNDPRGLAPEGWKIPSDEDWTRLTDFLGGESIAGTKMKSTGGWKENGNGTNASGFFGLPGGYRHAAIDERFKQIGKHGWWWSTTEESRRHAWSRNLSYRYGNIDRDWRGKEHGLYVRCIRD